MNVLVHKRRRTVHELHAGTTRTLCGKGLNRPDDYDGPMPASAAGPNATACARCAQIKP